MKSQGFKGGREAVRDSILSLGTSMGSFYKRAGAGLVVLHNRRLREEGVAVLSSVSNAFISALSKIPENQVLEFFTVETRHWNRTMVQPKTQEEGTKT